MSVVRLVINALLFPFLILIILVVGIFYFFKLCFTGIYAVIMLPLVTSEHVEGDATNFSRQLSRVLVEAAELMKKIWNAWKVGIGT
jgi:hypothetical protein